MNYLKGAAKYLWNQFYVFESEQLFALLFAQRTMLQNKIVDEL